MVRRAGEPASLTSKSRKVLLTDASSGGGVTAGWLKATGSTSNKTNTRHNCLFARKCYAYFGYAQYKF